MTAFLLLLVLGIISATFGSIVGLGGGIIIVPVLIYVAPLLLDKEMSSAVAVGTSLCVLIVTALASTLSYMKQNKVDFRSAWLYFVTSGPAAVVGSTLTGQFPQKTFELVFGCFMLSMALLMVVRDYIKPLSIDWPIHRYYRDAEGVEHNYGYAVVPALFIGFGVGLISGLFGIGGGSLFVPLMVLLFRYPPHVATATSMFVIFLSSILGSSTHVWQGQIDLFSILALAPGAWIGGKLGARIASNLTGKTLLWMLRLTLFGLALRMIMVGTS
jgi:uncharacterized membrane protein YfcA